MNAKTIVLLAVLAVLPLAAGAQVTEAEMVGEAVELTTAIVAIDAAAKDQGEGWEGEMVQSQVHRSRLRADRSWSPQVTTSP